jgi:molybdopterin converting factor small subunit
MEHRDRPNVCWVELFGPARLAAGVREVAVELRRRPRVRDVVRALGATYPVLVGSVMDVERGCLTEGYVFNRNGRDFIIDYDVEVRPGDRLLLLASSAGG